MNLPCRLEAEHRGREPVAKVVFQIFFLLQLSTPFPCLKHVASAALFRKAILLYSTVIQHGFVFVLLSDTQTNGHYEALVYMSKPGSGAPKGDRQFHYSSTRSF